MKKYYNPRYARSTDYRQQYLDKHKGFHDFYLCAYCGKIIRKKKMQVDHIISVNLAQNSWIYRLVLGKKNVNDINNLVASCPHCNASKGRHGGIWVLRGRAGHFAQPVLWLLFIIFLGFYTWLFFDKQFYAIVIDSIQQFLSNLPFKI